MRPLVFDRLRSDRAIAIGVMLFAAVALYVTASFDPPVLPGFPGAAFFPRLVLVALFSFGAVLLVRAWRLRNGSVPETQARADDRRPVDFDIGPVALGCAAALGAIALMQLAGFEIAGTLFIGAALVIRTRRWIFSALIGAFGTAVMYAVFVLALQVHLPLLFLPRYL
jgi:hypothetical protein